MKHHVVTLLLFAECLFGQSTTKTLDGFLEIAWGESMSSAKSKMIKRDMIQFTKRYNLGSGKEGLSFKGGRFAGQAVTVWVLKFIDNQFYAATLRIQSSKTQIAGRYAEIKSLITKKYGEPDMETVIRARWGFSAKGKEENEMGCAITEEFSILIVYQNGALLKQAMERDKAQQLQDL